MYMNICYWSGYTGEGQFVNEFAFVDESTLDKLTSSQPP